METEASPAPELPERELPVLGQPAPERADAARNRRRLLATAEEIAKASGVDAISMNEVAAAAGVGVGTVYRRFGDLAGLLMAMMDERERHLQDRFISGPPPLGPGASPQARIRAFLHAYVDLLDTYAELMAAGEAAMPPGRRYGSGAYAVHRAHLAALIDEARPGADAPFLADALLAPLAAALFLYHRRERGSSTDRIKAGLDALATGLLSSPGPDCGGR